MCLRLQMLYVLDSLLLNMLWWDLLLLSLLQLVALHLY